MSTPEHPASSQSISRDLPPYRAVLVVDARSFSDTPDALQADLNVEIQQVLRESFVRAGLASAWADRRFPNHTGDGYIVGLTPEKLPHVIHPLLRELQAELRERDYRRRAWEPRLRLRVSIHVGPLPDRGLSNDGVGRAMNETHRLLDSDRVRELLERTNPDVTFVAAILSRRAYEDAVEGGFTRLHPDQFVEVTATAKRFSQVAYLHVPEPSGALLRTGMADSAGAGPSGAGDPPPAAPAAPPATTVRHQSGGISIEGSEIHDGTFIGGDKHGDGGS
jgi:hypothetical protein